MFFASAKCSFVFFPLKIILNEQFKTPDFTQKQQAHKHVSLCQVCPGEQSPADDRWLTPEAVQSTLVKSAAQLLMAQLCSQSPRRELFLESSIWPSHQPFLGQDLSPPHLTACSALGLGIAIFPAPIPCVPVIPWNRLLVWQHSPVLKTYLGLQETLQKELSEVRSFIDPLLEALFPEVRSAERLSKVPLTQ